MVFTHAFLDLFGILFFQRVPIHTILALYVILYIGKLFLNRYVPLNIFQISVSIEYLLYYYMGFLFRRANVAKNSRMKDCAVLISAFILEVIFLLLWIQVKNRFLIDLIQPLVCGFQVAAVLTISRIFRAEKLSVFHTFQKISKNSMGIYLFHQQILYASMKIFTNFSPLLFVAVNFTIAFGVSYGITVILRKGKVGKLMIGESNDLKFA